MKKIWKVLATFLLLLLSVSKARAEELTFTFSEWSPLYPSGLSDEYIQSEKRYNWFKVENNKINYVNEYYANLDGYIKDEASEKIFYRYYTNPILIFDAHGNMMSDTDYCKKNYCYFISFKEPTMIDLNEKDTSESKYATQEMYELTPEVVPMTIDNIAYAVIFFIASLAAILFIMVKKRKKLSND